MAELAEIAQPFIDMAHKIVWCAVGTTDKQGRPRSRILHPIWELKDGKPLGWIATGATPIKVQTRADRVAVDPYGVASPDFVVGDDFAHLWCSALAHCQQRFESTFALYRREPSGGIGCFTPDNFPVFDVLRENVYLIADSNHGYKMIGVGALVAEELLGQPSRLLHPFRFSRFAAGQLHPVSNSPFPWS